MAETWNETTPPGSENPQQGDDRIREHKRAVRERLAADHHFESTETIPFGNAGSEIGFHKKVTLIEQASDPTTLENEMALYCKDNGGAPEAYIRPQSNGTPFQLTKSGKLLHNAVILPEQGSSPSTGANEIALYSKDVSGVSEAFIRQESNGTEIQATVNGKIKTEDHADTHIKDGSDETDGDKIDIDWNPTNYTPDTTPTEVDNVDHLTAHLYGIDQAFAAILASKPRYLVSADNTYNLWHDTENAWPLCTLTLPADKMGINGVAHCETVGFKVRNWTSLQLNFTVSFYIGATLCSKTFAIAGGMDWTWAVVRARLINTGTKSSNRAELEVHIGDYSGCAFLSNASIDTTTEKTLVIKAKWASSEEEASMSTYGGRLEVAPSN